MSHLLSPDENPAKKGISIFPEGAPPDETTAITEAQIPAAIDAIMASDDEKRMAMSINKAEVYHGIPHWYKGAYVQIFELEGKYFAFAKNSRGLELQTRGYDEYRTAMRTIYLMIERMRRVIV